MEKRKESLSDIKLCRFCLTQDSSLTSLYDRSRDPILVTLPLKIMACVSVEVFPSDKMPSYICERCRAFMDICYDFKQICRRADETCLQFVQNGVPISPVKWPPSLMKIFQLSKRAVSRPVNTVVEGGATIEITSQECSENDDEDEDTYNIKINASSDGSKHIKVSASGDKEPASPKKAAVSKGVMVRVRRRSSGLGSWACDECDSTYSLHQLLTIHKAQKHRAWNAQCSRCDAKFFTKYDLTVHQLRHNNEMPYQCIACNKKFKRLILLKRHEQIIHSKLPHFPCTNCSATFLSTVELEAHKKRHAGYFSRQRVCTVCDRKFHKTNTLHRHVDVVHGKKQFSCEYCPQRFSTVSKLSRHVRAHAGDRAYPCKYCNKSFLKSHHYTRHLRLKHEDQVRMGRDSGEPEFRCEQCSESFATQDDLYYHSAIHATQNLICPLCQEKFENVDEVTAHIRTHVNGIEFMCEYCELVFTSKEKLETHMNGAHDDEMMPRQDLDESSMDAEAVEGDADDDDEDNDLNVKEEDDHMVVEIKKADGYMLGKDIEIGQITNTNSEDSDMMEATYTELATVDTLALARGEPKRASPATKSEATSSRLPAPGERISILRKAEAMKRKAAVKEESIVPQKKERAAKVDSTTSSSASSDKSLRILEKELQELKRTTTRVEGKLMKAGEAKNKRQPVHTSTPKLRSGDEKKSQSTAKQTASVEKKAPERRQVTKEPKEAIARNTVTSSKEDKSVSSTKDDKLGDREERAGSNKDNNEKKNAREDDSAPEKQNKSINKEDKSSASKEAKSKAGKEDVPSSSNKVEAASTSGKAEKTADKNAKNQEAKETVKNGDTSSSEESVRRSTRPSKIKNYASMIRDRTRITRDEEDDVEETDEDEEYVEEMEADSHTSAQRRYVGKRQKQGTTPAAATGAVGARRRGRPRKDPALKDNADDTENKEVESKEVKESAKPTEATKEPQVVNKGTPADSQTNNTVSTSPTSTEPPPPLNMLMSPTGQTLKKVPIQSLPPGVKPLPLPLNARTGDLCQMQIGKKMVKVQKIVMTKAEVQAMAKKGLLELKDGTMVLKPGIKLPGEPTAVRSGLVSQAAMRKVSAATPTRCNIEGEEH